MPTTISATIDSIRLCDYEGNITGISDTADPLRNESFAYDALYRLTDATNPGMGGDGALKRNGTTVGVPQINHRKDKGGKCKDCEPTCKNGNQDNCLKHAFDNYPIGPYNAWPGPEPNSNTFAATLARACCKDGFPKGMGSTPGIDRTPPSPIVGPPWP